MTAIDSILHLLNLAGEKTTVKQAETISIVRAEDVSYMSYYSQTDWFYIEKFYKQQNLIRFSYREISQNFNEYSQHNFLILFPYFWVLFFLIAHVLVFGLDFVKLINISFHYLSSPVLSYIKW